MAGVTVAPKLFARLLARRALSNDTYEVEIERPAEFSFMPGQGVRIFWNDLVREYTVTSGPGDDRLAFVVQTVEKGRFSPHLASLAVGSMMSFTGPHGYFTFQSGSRPAVFVATGTGISPFVSMARAGITGFTLLQGARHAEDLHYMSVFGPAAARYVACLSEDHVSSPDQPWIYEGRVTDFLEKELAPSVYDFYLCGRREMVRDVMSIADDRFPGSRVFFEIFF